MASNGAPGARAGPSSEDDQPAERAGSPPAIPGEDSSTSGSGSEIDPNDFDVMLSRSAAYSAAPVMEPESIETAMLRGPRRWSVASSAARSGSGSRRRSSLVRRHRQASVSSSAIAEDDGVEPAPARTASPAHRRRGRVGSHSSGDAEAAEQLPDEDTPLLRKISSARSGPEEPATPFLNGVSPARFWLIFGEILATYFIACFDSTIMASSHPVITSYFNSSNSASWLSTAFLLTSTAFQPLLGRLSDTLGRKWLYVGTVTIFAFATAWCALAGSMTSFIFARAVCGLGAGGMMTLGSIIVSDLVPIE